MHVEKVAFFGHGWCLLRPRGKRGCRSSGQREAMNLERGEFDWEQHLIRKRSCAALLPVGTGFVVSPTKLWGIEPALWSTFMTTRRVACIGVWRS